MCKHKKGAGSVAVVSNPYRLPRTVIPQSYQLRLEPDLSTARFAGQVTIAVKVFEPVSEIVLNAVDLEISEATVVNANGTAFTAAVSLDEATERATIKVNGVVGKGDWQLKLTFTGELNDKLKGFYRSTYKDNDGVEQTIATTQFESTDARRAFPCFDEPDMKATFQVTLVVDEHLAAVSNARVLKSTPASGGKKVVEFAPTMKMSTYILAFVVGKLVATPAITVDGVAIRMWCVPGREHLATFSLESAAFALRYFKRYFGVAYPGDKLDLLAIPDFAAGAMENLGCVTFRETVLVDVATSSQEALDWVAEVVSHELAHMWFGDLVTMKWWNGLWLNEAFATFMAAKAVDAFKAEWKVWDKFGLSRSAAMRVDALGSTRPVEFTVNHPDDAAGMFDVLTYEKGCSVMRMLEQYLGEETFCKGIALYIAKNAYGNTETIDLWSALEEASGEPVREIMHGWIFASGYPVVSVKESDKAGCVTLSQQSFKFLSDAVDHSQLWMIPVMLRAKTAGGIIETKVLLTEAEQTIYIGDKLLWVVVNAGGHGFYRVRYSPNLAARLTDDVQATLSVIERVNMVNDAWACVRAGMVSALSFVELVKLFDDETNPNVWNVLLAPLAGIKELLPETHRAGLETLVRTLIKPTMDKLGWEPVGGESTQVSELRADIIHALGHTGNDETVHVKARQLFGSWKADRTSVDGNIISSVVDVVAHTGDAATYDEYWQHFKAAATPEDEERFLYALAKFPTADLAARTLEHAINPESIRTQDAPSVVARLMRNEKVSAVAWAFVKANWDKMVELYPESGLVGLCGGVTSLATPELEADVKAWFAAHPVKGGEKAIAQYLELLRVAVLFGERETAPLTAAFAPKAPVNDGAIRPPSVEDAGKGQA